MTEDLRSMLDHARLTIEQESSTYKDVRLGDNKKELPLKSKAPTTRYDRYRARLEKGLIENFNCDDVLFFFYDLLQEHHAGTSYFISNVAKEKKQIKIALERYGALKVLEMTEYLLTSGQTLLKIGTFSPAILSTSWGNTISVQTKEFVDSLTKPTASKREWGEPESKDYKVKIGEWGDE